MLHSRAFLLLEKEFREYKEEKIFGISILPIKDNWMEWLAEVEGLKDSLWEGAQLQLSLIYPENYNTIPPTVTFTTIPFHPNVDPETGRPCVDFLDDIEKWNTNFTMTKILLSIQVLLSNPILNNAVNLEAAQMLQDNYPLYRKRVILCVRNSRHLEAIASHWDTDTSLEFYQKPVQTPYSQRRKKKAISYEEYYLTWTEIATSRPVEDFKHPLFDDPDYIGNRYNWMAENVTKGYWDENVHEVFVSEFIEKHKKQQMLEKLVVSPINPSPTPASGSRKSSSKESVIKVKRRDDDRWEDKRIDDDRWEEEVDGLVIWSKNLD